MVVLVVVAVTVTIVVVVVMDTTVVIVGVIMITIRNAVSMGTITTMETMATKESADLNFLFDSNRKGISWNLYVWWVTGYVWVCWLY